MVIHLKRFQYSRYFKNKLETCVDFPVDNLDLSAYISHGNGESYRYTLYAVSNHYGSMGGGHYTAFVHVSAVPFFYYLLFSLFFKLIIWDMRNGFEMI